MLRCQKEWLLWHLGYSNMKYTLKRIFSFLIDFEHILTPVAVEHRRDEAFGIRRTYRILYIFGIRVMYYSTTKFEG